MPVGSRATIPSPKPARPSAFGRLGATVPVGIVLSIWPPLGGWVLLAALTRLGPWLQNLDQYGWLLYLLIAGILVGFSVVPTYACSILAGWAFGFGAGWPLTLTAMTAGSMMAYGFGRLVTGERIVAVIEQRPNWRAIHQALLAGRSGRTLIVVTLLRVPPFSPFALTNFMLAAAKVPFPVYTLGTVLGILPRTALTTYAAAQMVRLDFSIQADRWIGMAWIAVSITICLLLGGMANRAIRHLTPESSKVTAVGQRDL